MCRAGASWVQDDLLQKNPKAKVEVLAVWFPVLGGDDRSAWDDGILPDRRAEDFWDGRGLVSSWYLDHVVHGSGIVWDAYFLYGPGARWDATPGPALSSGGPVVDHTADLELAMQRFL